MSTSSSAKKPSTEDKRTLEEVNKENEALEKELASLRSALGIDRKEAEEEKKRVLAIFTKYDTDKSGFIDRKKFDTFAYEAGVGAEGLDEKGITEIFASIKPKKENSVTFEEFHAWFTSRKSKGEKKEELKKSAVLSAKLQSKALVASIESSRTALKSAKAKAEKKTERKEVKAIVGEAREGVRVRLQVGDFTDVGLGVSLTIKTDEKSTATLKKELEVPSGKGSFAFLDLGVTSGADEGKLGELAGILDGLVGAVGGGLNEKAGIPIYNGHTVKLVGSGSSRVLRVALFADINPTELIAAQFGKDPSVFNPGNIFDLRVALETPIAVAALKDPSFLLTLDKIKARFTIDGSISSSVDKRIKEATGGMLPEEKVELIAAGVRLFKGLNIDIQTISLSDLASKFTTPIDESNIRYPHEILRYTSAMYSSIPIFSVVEGTLSGVAAMAMESLPPELKPVYDIVRTSLTGPKRVHAQVDDLQVELGFTGFDIFSLLQPIKS